MPLRRERNVCESVKSHERRARCAEGTTPRSRGSAGIPGKGFSATLCIVIALVLGVATLAVFASYDVNPGNPPGDGRLAANFFSHEAGFSDLVRMLAKDRPRLTANGSTGIDLETLAASGTGAARSMMYRGLLHQISVKDLLYFPYSGKLILVPDSQENPGRPSETYLHLPHAQPQPTIQQQGYDWRGPGAYILTGDRPLKGSWFIHHDMTLEVAVAPY